MSEETTPSDVAQWMLSELNASDLLYQEAAAYQILDRFGEEFTYFNANGNIAISKPVLAAFNNLTGDDVVWSRSARFWRKREEHDLPGRQQP
jgi:hypothetical protein